MDIASFWGSGGIDFVVTRTEMQLKIFDLDVVTCGDFMLGSPHFYPRSEVKDN